jgi:hypothetical protein
MSIENVDDLLNNNSTPLDGVEGDLSEEIWREVEKDSFQSKGFSFTSFLDSLFSIFLK